MKDQRMDHIIKWAEFVRENPRWRKYHTQFINSLFLNNQRFIEELSKSPEGRKKLIELYGIKNLDGYPILKD
ncbi:MAG: hypothetical protein QXY45_04030 [Candidatus Aenigmatarchaeota archaeon]